MDSITHIETCRISKPNSVKNCSVEKRKLQGDLIGTLQCLEGGLQESQEETFCKGL